MGTVLSRERPVYTLRLGTDERKQLEAAAEMHQEHLAEYIRRTALTTARRELAGESQAGDL